MCTFIVEYTVYKFVVEYIDSILNVLSKSNCRVYRDIDDVKKTSMSLCSFNTRFDAWKKTSKKDASLANLIFAYWQASTMTFLDNLNRAF